MSFQDISLKSKSPRSWEILSNTLIHFLSRRQEEDLQLKTPLYPEYTELLESLECIWAYDPDRGVLTVRAIAKPLHDSINMYMSYFLRDLAGFLTPEENASIALSQAPSLLAGGVSKKNQGQKQPWHKYPDSAIVFRSPSHDRIPTVIVETGFTERYNDLLSDKNQWILKTESVNLVLIFNIKERGRPTKHDGEEAHGRIRALLMDYGNKEGKSRHAAISQYQDEQTSSSGASNAERPSDAALYNQIAEQVQVKDWVGELSVHLFWERDSSGGSRRRGNLVVSTLPVIQMLPDTS